MLQAISDKAGGNGRFTLRKNDKGNACVFLDGKKCRIYADRPMQVCLMSPDIASTLLVELIWITETQRQARACCGCWRAGGRPPIMPPDRGCTPLPWCSADSAHVLALRRGPQCRTYPFWPEIVLSEYDWAAEGQRCEGVSGRGSAAGAASGSAPPRPQLQSIDAHRENAAQRQRQWQQEAGLPGGSAAGSGTGSANARPPESSANGGEPAAESETERISAVVIRQQLLLQELHANNALPEMTYRCVPAWVGARDLACPCCHVSPIRGAHESIPSRMKLQLANLIYSTESRQNVPKGSYLSSIGGAFRLGFRLADTRTITLTPQHSYPPNPKP